MATLLATAGAVMLGIAFAETLQSRKIDPLKVCGGVALIAFVCLGRTF